MTSEPGMNAEGKKKNGNVTFMDCTVSYYFIYVYVLIYVFLPFSPCASASPADRERGNIEMIYINHGQVNDVVFWLHAQSCFVDIKERRRLDMCIQIHYPAESNNPLDIWNNWNMKKDNVYTDSEYRMCSVLYPHYRNKHFSFLFFFFFPDSFYSTRRGKGPLHTSLPPSEHFKCSW